MPYLFNNILFTPFAFLTSSISTAINEYIFDFNLIKSLIAFPFNSSFVLSITLDAVDTH